MLYGNVLLLTATTGIDWYGVCRKVPYMQDRRIELRVPEDLLARVDQARGLVSRAAWVRETVERALSGGPDAGKRGPDQASPSRPPDVPQTRVTDAIDEKRDLMKPATAAKRADEQFPVLPKIAPRRA